MINSEKEALPYYMHNTCISLRAVYFILPYFCNCLLMVLILLVMLWVVIQLFH